MTMETCHVKLREAHLFGFSRPQSARPTALQGAAHRVASQFLGHALRRGHPMGFSQMVRMMRMRGSKPQTCGGSQYMGGTPQIIHLFSCHQHVFNPSRLGYPNVHISDVIDEKSATGMSAAGFSLFNQPLWIPPFMETLCGRRIKLHVLQMGSSSKWHEISWNGEIDWIWGTICGGKTCPTMCERHPTVCGEPDCTSRVPHRNQLFVAFASPRPPALPVGAQENRGVCRKTFSSLTCSGGAAWCSWSW